MTIETELPAVKVKDLEWDNDGGWWGFYARKSIVGCYNVAQCRNEPKGDGVRSTDWFVSYPDIEALEIHPSEEAAKAAAQADYERRIISALTLKDDGSGGDGEAERLVDEAQFLLERLDELTLDDDTDDLIRDWNGHVEPSIARLRSALASYRKRSEADGQ